MKKMFRFALLAGAALLVSGPVFAQQAPAPAAMSPQAGPPAGDAKAGEALYMTDGCQECHGKVAQGSTFTGPRLAPGPVPYAAFIHQLREPASEMPPFEAPVLSDKDAADIYAFLQTVPQPPDYKKIKLLGGS